MAKAKPADVALRLGRGLTVDETAQATVLLADSETLITSRMGDIDVAIDAGRCTLDEVVMVEANSVVRVLRNPQGIKSETSGPFQVSIDTANVASGYLTITPDEWALLGMDSSAFGAGSFAPLYAANDPDSPWYGVSNQSAYAPDLDWS